MTFLAFTVDDQRFALPAADVITVVPAAPLRTMDGTPDWVAGVMPFFDRMLPVIDVSRLHAARAARRAFGTRIVVVRYPRAAGDARPLGLLAERVTDVLEVEPDQWRESGLATPDTPWLGPLARVGDELVQRVALSDLLPEGVRDRLFP